MRPTTATTAATTSCSVEAVSRNDIDHGAHSELSPGVTIAAASATLTFGLGKVGLVPEWGSSYLLWRQIGYSRALEVMLTARTIAADEALAMGLVNRVVVDDELVAAVDETARQIASLPPGTATAIKHVLRAGLDADFATARKTETSTLARRSRELAALRRAER